MTRQPIQPGFYLGHDGTKRRVDKVSTAIYFRHGSPEHRDVVTYTLIDQPQQPVQKRTVLEETFRRWAVRPLAGPFEGVIKQLTLADREVDLTDPETQKFLNREKFVGEFLNAIVAHMGEQGRSKKKLAQRLGYSPEYLHRIMHCAVDLTANMMADMAFHLGLKIKLRLEKIR